MLNNPLQRNFPPSSSCTTNEPRVAHGRVELLPRPRPFHPPFTSINHRHKRKTKENLRESLNAQFSLSFVCVISLSTRCACSKIRNPQIVSINVPLRDEPPDTFHRIRRNFFLRRWWSGKSLRAGESRKKKLRTTRMKASRVKSTSDGCARCRETEHKVFMLLAHMLEGFFFHFTISLRLVRVWVSRGCSKSRFHRGNDDDDVFIRMIYRPRLICKHHLDVVNVWRVSLAFPNFPGVHWKC